MIKILFRFLILFAKRNAPSPWNRGERRFDNDSNEPYPRIGWSRRVPISALESRHIRRKLHAQSARYKTCSVPLRPNNNGPLILHSLPSEGVVAAASTFSLSTLALSAKLNPFSPSSLLSTASSYRSLHGFLLYFHVSLCDRCAHDF